jgi:hypothetical protein
MLQLAVLAALIMATMANPVEASESYIQSSSGHVISNATSLSQAPVQTNIHGPVVPYAHAPVAVQHVPVEVEHQVAANWTVQCNTVIFG